MFNTDTIYSCKFHDFRSVIQSLVLQMSQTITYKKISCIKFYKLLADFYAVFCMWCYCYSYYVSGPCRKDSFFDLVGYGFYEVFLPLLFPQIHEPGKLFCLLLKRLLCPHTHSLSRSFILGLQAHSCFYPQNRDFSFQSSVPILAVIPQCQYSFSINQKKKKSYHRGYFDLEKRNSSQNSLQFYATMTRIFVRAKF